MKALAGADARAGTAAVPHGGRVHRLADPVPEHLHARMNRPMATYREHHVERMNRADDAAERIVHISVEWIIVAWFVAMLLGMEIGIDMAERERARTEQVVP